LATANLFEQMLVPKMVKSNRKKIILYVKEKIDKNKAAQQIFLLKFDWNYSRKKYESCMTRY